MTGPRAIPDPGFAGDDGAADPAVAAALEAYGHGRGSAAAVLAALSASRLLIPVVAVLDEAETVAGGLQQEKSSHMATVTIEGRDGRRALLGFSSVESLARWRPDARPVPATLAVAARAALDDGAQAIALDIGGPVPFSIEGGSLQALASGQHVVRALDGSYAWAAPASSGSSDPDNTRG